MTIEEANLRTRLNSFRYLVDKTRWFIADSLARITTPYVACSFGKDSAVMLHLILQQRPDVPVRFVRWDEETELINDYDTVIEQWFGMYPNLNLNQIHMSRLTVDDAVKERYKTGGEFDSFFIGLRMEESTDRRISLKTHGRFFLMKSGLTQISPLMDWKTTDIAAYVMSQSLPTLQSYKRDGMDSRTASRVPREAFGIRSAFLSNLRQRDVAAYNRLIKTFPELSSDA